MKCGWMVGSPPVSVTRSTRQAFSLGISRLVMSSYRIDWPALVADTKQCAQCRLHRSSICTSAFLVRKLSFPAGMLNSESTCGVCDG